MQSLIVLAGEEMHFVETVVGATTAPLSSLSCYKLRERDRSRGKIAPDRA